jgi:hypothetical protein
MIIILRCVDTQTGCIEEYFVGFIVVLETPGTPFSENYKA